MRLQDFFKQAVDNDFNPVAGDFDHELAERVIRGPISDFTDIELAEGFLVLLRSELTEFGTYGTKKLSDADVRLLIRVGVCVTRRLEMDFPTLPFRDFSGFKEHWKQSGMAWSYDARRQLVHQLLRPLDEQITAYVHNISESNLLDPIPATPDASWEAIEEELTHLRHRYSQAHTAQDLCAVGLACVRITEILGDVVFDATQHLPPGHDVPGRGSTINRFTYVIDHELDGPDNANTRRLVRGVIPFIQEVKHSGNPSKRDAALACDATISLVSIMRNITDPALK